MFQVFFEGVPRVLKGCVKGVPGVFQGCSKSRSRVLEGSHKGVKGHYTDISRELEKSYKNVTRVL